MSLVVPSRHAEPRAHHPRCRKLVPVAVFYKQVSVPGAESLGRAGVILDMYPGMLTFSFSTFALDGDSSELPDMLALLPRPQHQVPAFHLTKGVGRKHTMSRALLYPLSNLTCLSSFGIDVQ